MSAKLYRIAGVSYYAVSYAKHYNYIGKGRTYAQAIDDATHQYLLEIIPFIPF